MSLKAMADWNPGGPPGSLACWLFGLRLPPNQHRILELIIGSADAEDGCAWPSERYLAHWSGMSERNVSRIVMKLERDRLLAVWRFKHSSSVYQVQCPGLSRLGDLSRVEKLRGDKLSTAPSPVGEASSAADKSGVGEPTTCPVGADKTGTADPTGCLLGVDKTGEESAVRADKTGTADPTTCLPEVVLRNQLLTTEPPKEGTACAETSSAPAMPQATGHAHNAECECHPNPLRPRIDGVTDDSEVVVLVPLTASEGRPFAITAGLLERLARDHPGVDAPQAARNIRNWCLANPRRRKTPGGVAAFVTAWFSREQNRVGAGQAPSRAGAVSRTAQNVAAAAAFARGET